MKGSRTESTTKWQPQRTTQQKPTISARASADALSRDEPVPTGKIKISIRLDEDIVDHFMELAGETGGKTGYQTLMNDALRKSISSPEIYDVVRKAVRDEFDRHSMM